MGVRHAPLGVRSLWHGFLLELLLAHIQVVSWQKLNLFSVPGEPWVSSEEVGEHDHQFPHWRSLSSGRRGRCAMIQFPSEISRFLPSIRSHLGLPIDAKP